MDDIAGRRVLIVDDQAFIRALLRRCLVRLAVGEIREAENGADGLAELDTFKPELVLCDLNMPGMDGIEFLRLAATKAPQTPMLIVSGEDKRTLEGALRIARGYGLASVGAVAKPIEAERLTQAIARLQPAAENAAVAARVMPRMGEADLAAAIERGQIAAVFQPKIDVASGLTQSVECLARWSHPTHGDVSPGVFVPLAENCGLVDRMTEAVIDVAARDMAPIFAAYPDLRCAINFSFDTLGRSDAFAWISGALSRSSMPAERLIVEVTESRLGEDDRRTLETLARLRMKRVRVSLDDFGTGYASLARLEALPFDELKIDRGFVSGAAEAPAKRAILESAVALAKRMDLVSVAEGVETQADLDTAREAGIDLAQGYLIARPMPADKLLAWLAQ
ncbi:MAG: EAL domain-containing response regulator [Alphaproteobacteria bacterium]|nr:EAL domain-containing response regulator [Alphaproteobacteria bacterium]